MRKSKNYIRHLVGLISALVVLTSWVALPGYALQPNPAFKGFISTRPVHFGSAFDSIWSASGQMISVSVNAWSSTGPKQSIQSLAVDPINADTIYAGTYGGGVFKSTNGGASWFAINDGLGGDIAALVVDLVNPNILYAGTAWISGCSHSDPRLFKSIDAGVSWNSIGPPNTGCENIHALVMDPTNPNTVYATNLDDTFGDVGSLFKSANGGATWTGLNGPPFAVLAIDPLNPNTLYGGSYGFDYFGFGTGVFKSTDAGANWSATTLKNTTVNVLGIDPLDPSTVYAGTRDSYNGQLLFQGLFKSTDSGVNWSAINKGLTGLIDTYSSIVALVVDPDNPNIVFAGTSNAGVFRSIDGGVSWDPFNVGLTNLNTRALAIARGNPNTLYAGTSGGVFKIIATTLVPPTAIPRIISASVAGKRLFVLGENFAPGAVILLNGEEQATKADGQNSETSLIGKKAGKRVKAGDKLQVRNPNDALSAEFIFSDS